MILYEECALVISRIKNIAICTTITTDKTLFTRVARSRLSSAFRSAACLWSCGAASVEEGLLRRRVVFIQAANACATAKPREKLEPSDCRPTPKQNLRS